MEAVTENPRDLLMYNSLVHFDRKVRPKLNLTPKELEVVDGVWMGQSNADIARDMNIHEKGVKFHIRNIHKKLNVKSRLELLALLVAMLVEAQ